MLLVFSEREVRESLEMDRVANRQTFSSREIGRRRRNDEKFLHHDFKLFKPGVRMRKVEHEEKAAEKFFISPLAKKSFLWYNALIRS